MALIIFKYCLPALLGYILFVGISGQLMPFRKPAELAERPSWLLGLWTALAVTLMLTIGLNMAYQMSLQEVQQALKPSALLLAGILAPGFIAYFFYARSVRQEIAAQNMAETNLSDMIDGVEPSSNVDARDTELDQVFDDIDNFEEITDEDIELPVTAPEDTFADEFAEKISTEDAIFDPVKNSIVVDRIIDDAVLVTGIEHMSWTETPTIHTVDSDTPVTGIEHMHWNNQEEPGASDSTPLSETQPLEEYVTGIEHMAWPSSAAAAAEAAAEVELMRRSLESEVALREEAEKHLRVTRRGLSALESEQNHLELKKADALIKAEERLEAQIKRTATAEAHAERMEKQKAALEAQMLELKTSVVDAKREIRKSTTARARALNTANKSVAFAQQTVKERALFEARFKDAELALTKRQETISSLISALEKEKQRTQNEVSSMAKQMILQEKQLYARRSIEQASSKTEGKLSTRLVKKVAKGANKTAA